LALLVVLLHLGRGEVSLRRYDTLTFGTFFTSTHLA